MKHTKGNWKKSGSVITVPLEKGVINIQVSWPPGEYLTKKQYENAKKQAEQITEMIYSLNAKKQKTNYTRGHSFHPVDGVRVSIDSFGNNPDFERIDKLMKAAPELLRELKILVRWLDNELVGTGDEDLIEKAKQAIKKATE